MARDAAATQQRIIEAATIEFAEHGIAGARVDEIAARADVNKRMLYYYFGSKEELFREILRRRLAERVALAAEAEAVPRSEKVARRQAEHLNDLHYVRLLAWEALESADSKAIAAEDDRTTVYQMWVDATEAAMKAGELPSDLDPAQFVLSEIALTLFPVAFPQITRMVCGAGPSDEQFLKERQTFLRALFTHLSDGSTAP